MLTLPVSVTVLAHSDDVTVASILLTTPEIFVPLNMLLLTCASTSSLLQGIMFF